MKKKVKSLEKVTLTDIALALNKSVSTISKALSDSHEIGAATKQEIRDYAEKHNFQYNRQAKSLRTGQSYMIGIVVPAIGNAFFSQILEGIEQELAHSQYGLLFMQSKNDVHLERRCIETLFLQGVDGLIISPTGQEDNLTYLQQLLDRDFPIVLIDRINHTLNTYKVGITNIVSTFKAINHLIERGRKNILYITDQSTGVVTERLKGYEKSMAQHNLRLDTNMILAFDLYHKNLDKKLHDSIDKKLNSRNRPDAIFTSTDFLTHKTFGILKEKGVEIPRQIAFMGYSNTLFSNCFSPSLSCVVQPAEDMGKIAARKFLQLQLALKRGNPIEHDVTELEAKIISRDSI